MAQCAGHVKSLIDAWLGDVSAIAHNLYYVKLDLHR
jgi:hypothetical protein